MTDPILQLICNGTAYDLTNGTYCYYMADDGLGAAQVNRLSTRGYNQHGSTNQGYRLNPRYLRLYLDIQGTSWDDLFARRETLLNLFQPGDPNGDDTGNVLSLRWTYSTSRVRQIDCVFAGEMSMPSADRTAYEQRVGVSLKADDPTFYDPLLRGLEFDLGNTGMDVPTTVPTPIGEGTAYNKPINYTGTFYSYPVVYVYGPITDPVVTNETTGDKLDFTGVTIADGDYYVIDCAYSAKTVVNAAGTNKIAELTNDSDLATFAIAPRRRNDTTRVNVISVSGTGVGANSKILINYYHRYLGS